MSMAMSKKRLDLKGLKCPLPALRTEKLLNRLGCGDLAVVECTDPLAQIDIPHLAREMGGAVERISESAGLHVFHIKA